MDKVQHTTDPLAAALRKAGYRLIRSRLLNVRTGQRWLHDCVIAGVREGDPHTTKIFARML